MKIRIKSGDCPSYLTVGGVYEAWQSAFSGFLCVMDDDDVISYVNESGIISDLWEVVNQ